jgi:hypothetical protein
MAIGRRRRLARIGLAKMMAVIAAVDISRQYSFARLELTAAHNSSNAVLLVSTPAPAPAK